MTEKGQILIIDSTGNRRKELCELWSGVLGYDVLCYGGSDFIRFQSNDKLKTISPDELSNIRPLACLFHVGDHSKYKNSTVKKLVDSSRRVVMFSGVGLAGPKPGWPSSWFWIPRAITGKGSASDREWRQLGDWLATQTSGSEDGGSLELLSVRKRPQFLTALYILCQGFLAAQRMPERFPVAVAETRTRDWWSVPLVKSAGENLLNIVTQEWGTEIPDSVAKLVNWIANTPGSDQTELAEIVAEAKKELESRIAK